MRLRDLNPEWRGLVRDFTPETGGVLTGDYQLTFDCPKCGKPRKASINVGLGAPDAAAHRWQMNCSPDGAAWPDKLTLSPSIQLPATHGKGSTCGWHGHIIDGEVRAS